jgi:hypothetical protein
VSLPTPVTAMEIVPGCFLASAINSGSELTPSPGVTATNIGFSAVKPIGKKSRGSLSGRLGATDCNATKVESAGMNSV